MMQIPIPAVPAGSNDERDRFLKIHGLSMFIAWIILVPLSMIVVRIGSRWNRWFPVHVGCTVTATILTIVGGAIALKRADDHSRHFNGNHRILGFTVFLGLFLQSALGILISVLYKSEREKPPIIDKLHWWYGRGLTLLSFITVFLGLLLADMDIWTYIATILVILFFTILYCLLLILLP